MSDDHIDDPSPPNDPERPAPALPDERDATIERLERAVADERQNSTTLRDAVEKLRFKVDVLEKSYVKQLTDARLRSEAAERDLADHRARLAAFGSGPEDALRLLTETRVELQRITADRDQLQAQLARGGGRQAKIIPADSSESSIHDASSTINALIADAISLRERQPTDGEHAHRHGQARVDHEPPPEEMIAPELVFTKGRHDDEET